MTTKIPDALDREIHTHKFGVIEFRTQGAGCFMPGPKLIERIKSLSSEELREANKAAWKVRRKAEREANRNANVTMHGSDTYDRVAHTADVAHRICDATWRALNS